MPGAQEKNTLAIMYPINKPVSVEDVATRASELLARDEWTAWERVVLEAVRENATAVHAHYMRHAWYEIEGLGQPDPEAARAGIMAAVGLLVSRMAPLHGPESVVHSAEPVAVEHMTSHGAASLLLVHGLLMVDALVESLRRGPCAVDGASAYGLPISEWNARLAFVDRSAAPRVVVEALDRLEAGIAQASDGSARDEIEAALEIKSRRYENQRRRNEERIATVVALANENYALPEPYRLRIDGENGATLRLLWGEHPLADDTRPNGGDHIALHINALYELHPRVVADIARAGRFAAMCLGRDAEIVATGSALDNPPPWSWVGPLPLVRHLRELLRQGIEIPIGSHGITEGPFLYTRRLDLGGAVYAHSPRTLDESVTLDAPIDPALAHACIGNPISVVMQHPYLDDPEITIEACETDADSTDFDIASPLVRLVDAPDGVEADPEAAWLDRMADFDDDAVYGPRRGPGAR